MSNQMEMVAVSEDPERVELLESLCIRRPLHRMPRRRIPDESGPGVRGHPVTSKAAKSRSPPSPARQRGEPPLALQETEAAELQVTTHQGWRGPGQGSLALGSVRVVSLSWGRSSLATAGDRSAPERHGPDPGAQRPARAGLPGPTESPDASLPDYVSPGVAQSLARFEKSATGGPEGRQPGRPRAAAGRVPERALSRRGALDVQTATPRSASPDAPKSPQEPVVEEAHGQEAPMVRKAGRRSSGARGCQPPRLATTCRDQETTPSRAESRINARKDPRSRSRGATCERPLGGPARCGSEVAATGGSQERKNELRRVGGTAMTNHGCSSGFGSEASYARAAAAEARRQQGPGT